MDKKLIIGIGTGRCGTVSLSELVDSQKYSHITHEMRPLLGWKSSKDKLNERIKTILSQKERYVGDIAFFYLPHVEYILQHYFDTKIVCLKRDKSEVVKSYIKKTQGRNHWVNHRGLFWKKCEWDKCYPKYVSLFKKNAVRRYWDQYYQTVDNLKSKYPSSILLMDMYKALNTKYGIRKLLTFAGIDKKDWVIKANIKKNAG